jgi:arylsulfatase A-like enzyme
MNVVVVVMDSLRADHIYGSHARTESWDKVGRQGLRFLNAYPEGMPTIPARRAIMSGKRTFPFRGWRPRWDDLPPQPGWEPVGSDGEMWTATLREAGWTTIAQDQASSVVYGMPKAAAELGAAERVLPLSRIARAIIDAVETAVPARRVR